MAIESSAVVYDHKNVVVSGLTFANILHEATRSTNDAEGIIYGKIVQSLRDKITDSDATGNHQELQFAIQEIVSFESTFSFYNHLGQLVCKDEIQNGSGSGSILGWYKIRRSTSNRISLRERAVIRNLIKTYKMNDGLIFLLVTPSYNENRTSHSFSYKCFFCQDNGGSPGGISVHIINLGESGTHSEYKHQSSIIEPNKLFQVVSNKQTSPGQASAMSQILSSFKSNFLRADGAIYEVSSVHKLYQETIRVTKEFQRNISEVHKEIVNHKKEIEALQKKIDEKNRCRDAVMLDESAKENHDDKMNGRGIEHDDESMMDDEKNGVVKGDEKDAAKTDNSEEF
eukprot:gene5628-6324_t